MAVPEEQALEEVELTPAEAGLNSRELAAYRWLAARPQPPLSPDAQAKMFALFLQGTSCEEIARLNKGISLAQIVQARVIGEWDRQRDEHLQGLLLATKARLHQVTLEGVEFVANLLAATHKQHGDKLKKFIQTGDPADLGEFSIRGLRSYREAVELLKVLTGHDGKKVSGEVTHKHIVDRALTAEEAQQAIGATVSKGGIKR